MIKDKNSFGDASIKDQHLSDWLILGLKWQITFNLTSVRNFIIPD